jgi:hypothetical protein
MGRRGTVGVVLVIVAAACSNVDVSSTLQNAATSGLSGAAKGLVLDACVNALQRAGAKDATRWREACSASYDRDWRRATEKVAAAAAADNLSAEQRSTIGTAAALAAQLPGMPEDGRTALQFIAQVMGAKSPSAPAAASIAKVPPPAPIAAPAQAVQPVCCPVGAGNDGEEGIVELPGASPGIRARVISCSLVEVTDELASMRLLDTFEKMSGAGKGKVRFEGNGSTAGSQLILDDGTRRLLPAEVEMPGFRTVRFLIVHPDLVSVAGAVRVLPREVRIVPAAVDVADAALTVTGISGGQAVLLDGVEVGEGQRTVCIPPRQRHEVSVAGSDEAAMVTLDPGRRVTLDFGKPLVVTEHEAKGASSVGTPAVVKPMAAGDDCKVLCSDYAVALSQNSGTSQLVLLAKLCNERCNAADLDFVQCVREGRRAGHFTPCADVEPAGPKGPRKDLKSACAAYGVVLSKKQGSSAVSIAKECMSRCKDVENSFCDCVRESQQDSELESCMWK